LYGPEQSYKTKMTLYYFRQKRGQDLRSFYDRFLSIAKLVEDKQVTIGPDRATMGLVGSRVPIVEATVPGRHSRPDPISNRSSKRHHEPEDSRRSV
jgi:hypothetical protein